MTVSLHDQYELYNHQPSGFRERTIAAIAETCYNILAEDPETENHAARLAWAQRVLRTVGPVAEWDEIKFSVLSNATIAADPNAATDNDILYVVNLVCYLYA